MFTKILLAVLLLVFGVAFITLVAFLVLFHFTDFSVYDYDEPDYDVDPDEDEK